MKKMKVLYVVWGVLVVSLVGVLTYLGFQYKEKLKPYKYLEDKLISVTEKYVELKFLYPEEGEKLKVTTKELIKSEMLKGFSVDKEKCEGYVIVSYNGVYNYDSFIKCANYKTKGF